MRTQTAIFSLTPSERSELERVVRHQSGRASACQRARMVLLAAEGTSKCEIGRLVGSHYNNVAKWLRRWRERGMDGLADEARSGRPVELTATIVHRVIAKVCRKPPAYLSRWSTRTLAAHLEMPASSVHRILSDHDLHPHHLRTFTFSPDPRFEEKLLEVVGLYMAPPENAVVLCVDEKTGIQALDRTQPVLPIDAKKPRAWTNEYVRHGTRTLLASLDVATGEVFGHVKKSRTSRDFLHFMDDVSGKYAGKRLCVIMDNLNTHNNPAAKEWLSRHPGITFHYTPTHASWVNLIEAFFGILTKQGLQQAVHTSGRQLARFLKLFIAKYNERCGPFVWTKGPTKLRKIIELTKEFQKNSP
jgi:transposase